MKTWVKLLAGAMAVAGFAVTAYGDGADNHNMIAFGSGFTGATVAFGAGWWQRGRHHRAVMAAKARIGQ